MSNGKARLSVSALDAGAGTTSGLVEKHGMLHASLLRPAAVFVTTQQQQAVLNSFCRLCAEYFVF